jgi:hypothetical protein
MFMLKSTHDAKMETLEHRIKVLEAEKYTMLKMIHTFEDVLINGNSTSNSGTFTDEQLRKLLQLCHPDKHNDSKLSIEVTQMLNKARKNMKKN